MIRVLSLFKSKQKTPPTPPRPPYPPAPIKHPLPGPSAIPHVGPGGVLKK
jgi:hypothetical protein